MGGQSRQGQGERSSEASQMRFEDLVRASLEVQQTRSRTQKVQRLAACIQAMYPAGPGESLEAGVAYLAGELPFGRIGLGPAAVYGPADVPARASGELSVGQVAQALQAIQSVQGPGSVAERS